MDLQKDRDQERAAKRHELANLISIALANLEALADGTLAVSPQRLENVCESLRSASKLLDELR